MEHPLLAHARRDLPDQPDAAPVYLGGCGSHVWTYGDYRIYINELAPALLENAARLLTELPSTVPHAAIVARGSGWLVVQQPPGQPLSHVWATLSDTERRTAARQFAAVLRVLHSQRIRGVKSLSPGWFKAILPREIGALVTVVKPLELFDPALLDTLNDYAQQQIAAVPPPLHWGLAHCQLALDRVWWHNGQVSALFEFHHAIFAPVEVELDYLLRFCATPDHFVESAPDPQTLAAFPDWLREDYPELFDPDADARARRLSVFALRADLSLLTQNHDCANTPEYERAVRRVHHLASAL